ncbi:hypothetical protein VTN31DRAFT_6055 [Thermomyces dupontii]|uniref:uncharacterized protein n=1 Tax=Talaromyces thermophilus TaxID=28565 RepID=UPI00374433E3
MGLDRASDWTKDLIKPWGVQICETWFMQGLAGIISRASPSWSLSSNQSAEGRHGPANNLPKFAREIGKEGTCHG